MRFSKEEEYLRQKDKKLKKIIDRNGHIVFKPIKKNEFDTLVGIVVSQFISTKAANSIFNKIRYSFNSEYLNENHFEKLNINQIKKLGLSTNKAKTIKELSNLFLNNKNDDLSKLNAIDLNERLLSVFGIGPWSLNMYEIFSIGKLNVFTSKDAGLRLAMNKSGMIKPDSKWQEYDEYANKWSPYKSIASLHLWKTVD
jgi:DNA-3-methyladenine glycosylase II